MEYSNLDNVRYHIDMLKNEIAVRETSIVLDPGFNVEEVKKALILVQYEYPEIVYPMLPNEILFFHEGSIILMYNTYDENLFNEKLNEITYEINSKFNYSTTTYEKVKIIYDYITSNMTYDFEAFNEYKKIAPSIEACLNAQNQPEIFRDYADTIQPFDEKYASSCCIYGPVVNKKGTCAGLVQLFKYLLSTFGINNTCVFGDQYVSDDLKIRHVISAVEVDGEWAFVDIANGMKNITKLDMTLYKYFMVSKEELNTQFVMDDEYNNIYTVNHLTFYKKYNLEFDNMNALIKYLDKFIVPGKEKKIYCKYVGTYLNDRKIIKIVEDVVVRKIGRHHELSDASESNEKFLTLKIQPRERKKHGRK